MEKTTLTDTPSPLPDQGGVRPPGRPWWRRFWFIPLAVAVAAFLIDELPPYFTLDPAQARIQLHAGFWPHYTLLVAHIAFGSVALITVCLQVWPWLRRRHPRVHRWSGRFYVFGGALPSALLALALMPFAAGGYVGVTIHSIGWLATTVIGYRMIRQRRYAAHRRWMLYSFALAMGILWGRATVLVWPLLPAGTDLSVLFEMARWFGWMLNLVLVQWWLERGSKRRLVSVGGSKPSGQDKQAA